MAQKIRKRFAGKYDILEILVNSQKNHATLELIRYYQIANISSLVQEIKQYLEDNYPEIQSVRIYFDNGKYNHNCDYGLDAQKFDNNVVLVKVPIDKLCLFIEENISYLITYSKLNHRLIDEIKKEFKYKGKEDSDGWTTVMPIKSTKKDILEYIKLNLAN